MKQSSQSILKNRKAPIGIVFLMALLSVILIAGCGQSAPDPLSSNDASSSKATDSERPSESNSTQGGSWDEMQDGYLTGPWECVTKVDNTTSLIFILEFWGENNVSYTTGAYQGEIMAAYTGTYTIQGGNTIQFKLTPDKDFPNAAPLNSTFLVKVEKDKLTLTLKSGDALAKQFGKGVPMVFNRR